MDYLIKIDKEKAREGINSAIQDKVKQKEKLDDDRAKALE